MTRYYKIGGIMFVSRGGDIKAYSKVNGDFAEIVSPHNASELIANERRRIAKAMKCDNLAISQVLKKKKLNERPKLKRNEKHISSCIG